MIETIEVINNSQLNSNNTVTYPAGSNTVLSVQPDGSVQTRPKGTAGPYEIFRKTDKGLVFTPEIKSYLVPYVE